MTNEIGTRGELVVMEYLKKKNYEILQKNYRTRTGEIDIIVCKADRLKFVEVKTMLHTDIENLRFLIDKKKRKKIVQTAKQFLLENRQYRMMNMSFDVAVLKTNPFLNVKPEILYIENAFGDFDGN